MKIRIKGNTLRLRLTQSEVEAFSQEGRVSDSISFVDNQLIYTLQAEDRQDIAATYSDNFITVCVPHQKGKVWADSQQVGIQGEMALNEDKRLTILIEKDFQCLKPRAGEDETDLYANPLAVD